MTISDKISQGRQHFKYAEVHFTVDVYSAFPSLYLSFASQDSPPRSCFSCCCLQCNAPSWKCRQQLGKQTRVVTYDTLFLYYYLWRKVDISATLENIIDACICYYNKKKSKEFPLAQGLKSIGKMLTTDLSKLWHISRKNRGDRGCHFMRLKVIEVKCNSPARSALSLTRVHL